MKHIPDIHLYCNRWCARCPLQHRCALSSQNPNAAQRQAQLGDQYQSASPVTKAPHTDSASSSWEELDWAAIRAQAETFAARERPAPFDGLKHPLYRSLQNWCQRMERYWQQQADYWQAQLPADGRLALSEQQRIDNCRAILIWYSRFLPPKFYRALAGQHEAPAEHHPAQEDWNGSAKVGLLGLGFCQKALGQLVALGPDRQTEAARQELASLNRALVAICAEAEACFPHWRQFERPGFDSLGIPENLI